MISITIDSLKKGHRCAEQHRKESFSSSLFSFSPEIDADKCMLWISVYFIYNIP